MLKGKKKILAVSFGVFFACIMSYFILQSAIQSRQGALETPPLPQTSQSSPYLTDGEERQDYEAIMDQGSSILPGVPGSLKEKSIYDQGKR